jgi:hypothetical protein
MAEMHRVISQKPNWIAFLLVTTLINGCGGKDEAPPAPTTGAVDKGVLRVLGSNPRWLTDDSGEAKYFTGPSGQFTVNPNATVSTVQDQWSDDVNGVNDYATAFDTVVANGHNFVRLWRWETSAWGSSAQFASNSYQRVPTSQMPWTRVSTRVDSSTGTAVTVGVYDLEVFNQTYFDRLRAVVMSAVSKGITPSVMLFEGYENQIALAQFSGFAHPMMAENNINGVSCDVNADTHCEETHSLTNETLTAYQTAYVKKVIDTLNDIDGYIYEIANESTADSVSWQNYIADLITTYESTDGRQRHPVWMTPWYSPPQSYSSNDYLYNNSHVHIVTPTSVPGLEDFVGHPTANQANKNVNVWFHDSDHGEVVNVDWPWKAFTRGISPLYLDCPIAFCTREPDSLRPLIMKAMAQTLRYAKKINLRAMTVESGRSIIGSGYGLYQSCAEYLMYMPTAGSHTINLGSCGPDQSFTVELFEPLTGETTFSGTVQGSTVHTFNTAGSNTLVVYLQSTQK